ncbi:MAG TPA: RlmE family RNA methyltransferase [Candidatus Binataceae bacterium]|nr:RlmE family RNA methyltransferase [Candidatus Binataceae bacterium]
MARYEPQDKFYRRARAQGLPSRAAFKLEEILARFKLVRAGARVVDLGCAPGGWLAILGHAAGAQGRVVGIDLSACAPIGANVATIAGDIRDPAVRATVTRALGGAADLLTSDLSPKLTGIAERDQALSFELIMSALDFACAVLKPGGALVAKLFMGSSFDHARTCFERRFAQVEVVRTRASRPGSAELYIVAQNFRPAGARE